MKHSTRLKITAQTCKTQHKEMKTQQRDLKTEHTQAEGEIGYQPSLLLTSNICGHFLFLWVLSWVCFLCFFFNHCFNFQMIKKSTPWNNYTMVLFKTVKNNTISVVLVEIISNNIFHVGCCHLSRHLLPFPLECPRISLVSSKLDWYPISPSACVYRVFRSFLCFHI